MEFQKVSKKMIGYLMGLRGLFLFICCTATIVLSCIKIENGQNIKNAFVGLGVGVCLLSAVYCFLFSVYEYKNFLYYYDDQKIVIKKGFIFKRYVEVPVIQIQDIGYTQNPIQLMLNIGTVVLSTAGSNQFICSVTKEIGTKIIEDIQAKLTERIEKYGKN